MAPVLQLEHVVVRFEGRDVLDDVSLEIPPRRVTVLTGPSGSGKTTLLRLCNRLEVPTSGRVLFRDTDLSTLDPLALRRQVGMVFQRPTLFAGTVRDNLQVARPDGDDEYAAALERVGLPRRHLDDQGDNLSGGEAQRACLARTLLTGPEVLLMDEPTSSLDPAAARVLEDLTADLVGDGLTVLWVSHDLAQARRIADHTVVLVAGRVAADDAAAEYLGR
ncbi:MAG TPA: phosphate ABC transporter ATP-binding protein [Acidimicrobiales bacterium]|nr:phosphate ABC transporter ATP-binding protein [Acidimicrobiales bacterium]